MRTQQPPVTAVNSRWILVTPDAKHSRGPYDTQADAEQMAYVLNQHGTFRWQVAIEQTVTTTTVTVLGEPV